ncbi:MAG: outer membrane protein assembly factor BamC [Gammaproteobacteria bacterium]|nr:outer membrane protein assembly factor BamC [Gammaproteobacteria bacterium]
MIISTSRLLAFALLFSLTACSGGAGNSRLDYKEAKSLEGLDVPPDLVAPENSGETELPALGGTGSSQAGVVLPRAERVRIARDGAERWLLIDMPADEVWPRLRTFWATLGLELRLDRPELGIMETAWAENRADAPSGFLTDLVKSVFKNAYSAGTRDKYRLRLERGDNGVTELYLTHYGLKEVVASRPSDITIETAWEVRPSDRELANEVMNRLVLYLGGSTQAATSVQAAVQAEPERARIEGDELLLSEGFARSWRRTGIALDTLGVVVEDRDRSEGIYYIGQIDLQASPEGKGKGKGKGWFSSLFVSGEGKPGDSPQLQILLRGDEALTRLVIRNMDGTPRQDELAADLLQRLQQELK